MQKIHLKTALAFMDTAFIEGRINVYSIRFYKMNGNYSEKSAVCKFDPEVATEQIQKMQAKSQISSPKPSLGAKASVDSVHIPEGKRKFYDFYKKRVIRLFDLEKKTNFTIKIDLIIQVNDWIIDHKTM